MLSSEKIRLKWIDGGEIGKAWSAVVNMELKY